MKRIVLLIVLLFSTFIFSQKKEKSQKYDQGELLFLKAENYLSVFNESIYVNDSLEELDTLNKQDKIKYEVYSEIRENIYDDVLDIYSDIVEKHSKSKIFFKSLYNKAFIEKELGYIEDAIETNIQLINSKANDLEKGGLGEGLMAEPYANYKNRACRNLVNLYIEKQDFNKAKKYFNLTRNYPYQHFCGNAHATDEVHMASLESNIYIGLKQDREALRCLLPYVFGNLLTESTYVEDLAFDLVEKLDVKTQIKNEIESQAGNIKARKVKYGKDKVEEYFITLFDKEINITFIRNILLMEDSIDEKEKIKKALLESDFYKKLLK